ncbi:MAG: tRNA uridine-5-carboxymethylaminomethyl(34) synthesis GTPase MnmE, partial [Bacteroidota bacterium]|nr:tRNA uridine-5-carboxymethylaminomethyl(34) synthesis GTPase MnmE [Bacteroidota bacterium]
MMMQLPGWDDTIVALATPPGVGALGVIRLSGKKSIEIANKLFVSKDISKSKAPAIHVGFLKKDHEVLDEVVLTLFKAPASYTGEDVIEFSCHGSPFIHHKIIEACIEGGARLAKPGEFTQRAFLNGKLDLAQAEAVADLIVSNTAASHKTALDHMRGGFSSSLKSLREQLIQFSALIELELDFSQEDVEFADRTNLQKLVVEAQQHTGQLIQSFKLGNVIKHGVSVAIIGKPNSGKSTLLNALLNEDRAIVSEIAGTTRDTIEEVLNIDGILFRLIDTAGIREHATDIIETAGIERSIQKMKQADLVIYLFDANEIQSDELKNLSNELSTQKIKFLLVGNKTDLANEKDVREKFSAVGGIIFISAKENLHIEVLKERMLDMVLQDKVQGENVIVTNARHYHTLLQVDEALSDVLNGLETKLSGDLLALDIRRCLQYLG